MIALIKYNAGNTQSVQNALTRLGYKSMVTDDKAEIRAADKVIFPGVGEAKSAMNYLTERGLDKVIYSLNQPCLGICLGLQLMCKSTEEGHTKCLGIFDTEVKLFPPKQRVPHMGWNSFSALNDDLFHKVSPEDSVYYVHSYYAQECKDTIATCNYIRPFSAALKKGNFYATQFHPEKSAEVGAQILENFLAL